MMRTKKEKISEAAQLFTINREEICGEKRMALTSKKFFGSKFEQTKIEIYFVTEQQSSFT
jgi:hypothetical protein